MALLYDIFVFLTLVADASLLLALVVYIYDKDHRIFRFLARYALLFALIISTVATFGSLYFSEVLGWEPCRLCWFQRIFMYPLPLMFGMAIWKKDAGVWKYAMPLAIAGSHLSVYHYYIQRFPAEVCSTNGVSCAAIGFSYGYISIPVMAFTAFAVVILLGALSYKR